MSLPRQINCRVLFYITQFWEFLRLFDARSQLQLLPSEENRGHEGASQYCRFHEHNLPQLIDRLRFLRKLRNLSESQLATALHQQHRSFKEQIMHNRHRSRGLGVLQASKRLCSGGTAGSYLVRFVGPRGNSSNRWPGTAEGAVCWGPIRRPMAGAGSCADCTVMTNRKPTNEC